MKGLLLKSAIGIVALFFLTFALLFYLLSKMSVFELVLCSADEGGILIPGTVCEYYMKNYRSGEEDIQELAKGGLEPILNLDNEKKKYELAEFFISKGLDVDGMNHYHYKRKNDSTPLHNSVIYNDPERVRFLIDQGADPEAKSQYHNNMTPLELAQNLESRFPDRNMEKIIQLLSN